MDSVVRAENSPPGFGSIMEFKADPGNAYSFEQEHHTVWYEFQAFHTGWLEMVLKPEHSEDDYDFLVFPFFDETTCDSIHADMVEPIRSVISRNDTLLESITGLSDTAFDTHVPQGPGPSFASSFYVREGQKYLLVVDNVYADGGGHTIAFHYKPTQQEPPPPPPPSTHLVLHVVDSAGNPLEAQVSIRFKYSKDPAHAVVCDTTTSILRKQLNASAFYVIQIRREGYLTYSENIRTRPSEFELKKEIKLETLVIGKSFHFENVYFRGGTDQFLPGTQDALKQILKMLKDNPNICIEIQGHINQPYNLISRMSAGESKQLSDLRAKAVYEYLVRKGIDPRRLEYKGYGNSRMIYPYAKDEEEMKMNRRVEIVITKLEAPD